MADWRGAQATSKSVNKKGEVITFPRIKIDTDGEDTSQEHPIPMTEETGQALLTHRQRKGTTL